jgi:hypothetical protein
MSRQEAFKQRNCGNPGISKHGSKIHIKLETLFVSSATKALNSSVLVALLVLDETGPAPFHIVGSFTVRSTTTNILWMEFVNVNLFVVVE